MDKNPALLYKTFVVGVIVLFIGIGIQPTIANESNIHNEIKEDIGEIEKSDDYEELITIIKGWGDLNWMTRRGFFRGEALLICRYQYGLINLSGYRRSESGIEYYNELIEKGLVYANRLICYYVDYSIFMRDPRIVGIAIGNIVWEEYE
jgi:hypothetical protein